MMGDGDDGPDRVHGTVGLVRGAALLQYIDKMESIEGWCSRTTALAMAEILWHQERQGVVGGIAEIGVHHGKSFIPLVLAARPDECPIAIDVFERQDLNIDGSGHGSRSVLLANLSRFAPGRTPRLIAESSLNLWGHEDEFGLRGLRFLSVDGGHTRDVTLNDLLLADALLVDDGVCVLDDILNAHWPGVVSGAFAFMAKSPRLVPLAIIPNKLVLCRRERVPAWRKVMRALLGDVLEKHDLEFGDLLVDVFGEMPERRWLDLLDPRAPAPDARDAVLRAEIQALRSSTSWRVTAPIRAFKRLLRGD